MNSHLLDYIREYDRIQRQNVPDEITFHAFLARLSNNQLESLMSLHRKIEGFVHQYGNAKVGGVLVYEAAVSNFALPAKPAQPEPSKLFRKIYRLEIVDTLKRFVSSLAGDRRAGDPPIPMVEYVLRKVLHDDP